MDSSRILYNRLYGLIESLASVECAVEALYNEGLLNRAEKTSILESADKGESLCQALMGKGITRLVEISRILGGQAQGRKPEGHLSEACELKRSKSTSSDVISTSGTTSPVVPATRRNGENDSTHLGEFIARCISSKLRAAKNNVSTYWDLQE